MAPPENTTTTFQGLLNWRLALHVFISIFRPREVWNKLLLGAFQPRVVKNPIFWGMNTPSNPNKQPTVSNLETDFRSLLFPQVQGATQSWNLATQGSLGPMLAVENMISDVFREACFPSLDSINQVFCWEKKTVPIFFGGESCFYTTLPMKSHYPPPKAVGKLSFLYQLVEYVRVTLWHPSKALGCRHWRRASKLHMLVRYNQTIPKPWLVGVWFSFTIYRFIKFELVRSCQIGKKKSPPSNSKKENNYCTSFGTSGLAL